MYSICVADTPPSTIGRIALLEEIVEVGGSRYQRNQLDVMTWPDLDYFPQAWGPQDLRHKRSGQGQYFGRRVPQPNEDVLVVLEMIASACYQSAH